VWPFVQPLWEHTAWSPQSITCQPSSVPPSCARGQCVDAAVAAIFTEGVVNPHMHARGEVDAYLDSRDGSGGGNQQEYYRSACHHRLVSPARDGTHSDEGCWQLVPAACDARWRFGDDARKCNRRSS
jgi:hypothetical protein